MPGGGRRRRGAVSAEVYTEEDAATYVKKVSRSQHFCGACDVISCLLCSLAFSGACVTCTCNQFTDVWQVILHPHRSQVTFNFISRYFSGVLVMSVFVVFSIRTGSKNTLRSNVLCRQLRESVPYLQDLALTCSEVKKVFWLRKLSELH